MESIEKIVQNFLKESKVDFVGLWQITSLFGNNLSKLFDPEMKEKSLIVARKLIENGVCPGFMEKDGGFNFMKGTTDELIAQIATSWPKTGNPNLGTNHCWFAAHSQFDAEGKFVSDYVTRRTKDKVALNGRQEFSSKQNENH